MIQRLLIANRGEIALRILRACRECGVETVAAYARADQNLLHLDYADEIICISDVDYLDMNGLLMAARVTGCDAVHPGYGFLSENAEFARRVEEEGLTWIGPGNETIEMMGNKAQARAEISTRGLQPIPGSKSSVPDNAAAESISAELGYPVALKASFGGGGRGIRVVPDSSSLAGLFEETENEARAIFGRRDIYVEKYLGSPRHIEIQIMGDGFGQAVHLGSRECSIQRRHQKLIEEAPAPHMDPELLDRLGQTCAAAAAALNYRNAGTFEFLYEDREFYFIEMNTRLQVEHPVTEMVTGLDLVRMQLEVASTGKLPVSQEEIRLTGHAIECRINAEDSDYRPVPGTLTRYHTPGGPGIRVDSHLYQGYKIPHQYDSLIGKLISHGCDREQAIARMVGALNEMALDGIDSNLALHEAVLLSDLFRRGDIDTTFLRHWVSE
ncbi:MAG: acetyl-CoA carboxylase biotin carboxylase subunit [Pseudomonadales bacterium]